MKKYFFAGLATLLPIAVTVLIFNFFVHLLTRPFIDVTTRLVSQLKIVTSPQLILNLSQLFILIGLFLFICLLGMAARKFFFSALLKAGDKLLHRIPLVNKVYKTTKEIIRTLFSSKKNSFKQVVMIPFPKKNSYCLGLVTLEAPKTCQEAAQQKMVSVFIPTTPNPTTGYMLVCPEADLILLDMKSDEAIKFIVSCGAIQPNREEKPA